MELEILNALEKVPESIVEGLWNGEVMETDKEHLNMIANSVSLSDLEDLVSCLRQRKTKDIIEQTSVRSLVIILYSILEKGGEPAYVAAKVHNFNDFLLLSFLQWKYLHAFKYFSITNIKHS